MNQDELIGRYQRLLRKLSTTHDAWRSGRVDQLRAALQSVERQLGAGHAELAAGAVRARSFGGSVRTG